MLKKNQPVRDLAINAQESVIVKDVLPEDCVGRVGNKPYCQLAE